MIDRANKQAFRWLAWNNGWAEVAPFDQSGQRVDAQVILLLVGTMALLAMRHQQRADPPLKELKLRRVVSAGRCRERNKQEP